MSENPIADYLNAPGTRASFHVGDFPQTLPSIDGEPTEADLAALAADRASLRVPTSRPRFGVDEDGVPIEAPLGGIPFDSETGALATPDTWPKLGAERSDDGPRARSADRHGDPEAPPKPTTPSSRTAPTGGSSKD
jgi:hypothetical protein